MGGRYRLEAWTMPSSGDFRYKLTVPALHGSAGTRELSGYADEQAIVAADWDGIDQVVSDTESSWIRVFDMDQVVDEFIAERVLKIDDRPSARALTGPQRNGIVERFAVYPYRWPVDKPQAQDWIWGGENTLPDLGLADLESIREEWTLYLSGERYELDVSLATSGDYLLSYAGNDTAAIAFDATDATIKSELESLPGITEVTVLQPDPDRREFIIVVENPKDLPSDITADFTGTGGLGNLTKLNDGFDTGTDPTFTISVDGDTTEALPWDATASQLEGVGETLNPPGSGLQGLTTVADVLVSGSGTAADPWTFVFYDPPNPGTVSVTFLAGTAELEKTVDGAVDPSPITQSQEIDQSIDENIHGTYDDPALEVVTDPAHLDTGADWALKVNATGRYAGSQIVVPVTPGMTYQAKIRVKPTVTGDYTLVFRDQTGTLIAQPTPRDNTLTAGVYSDIVVVDIEVPDNVDQLIMRVAVTDDSPAAWAPFYVNWQLAELREGQLEATPGQIIRQLLEACHARGTATFLELGCTDTLDSAGVAWPAAISFTVFFGANAHLGVALDQLHENGYEWRVDVKATPAGGVTHTLNLWNKGPIEDQTTSSGAPTVVVGSDVVDARVASRFAPFTALLAHGLEGLRLEDVNSAAAAVVGRWERIVDAEHLASEEALQEFLTAQFEEEAANRTAASAIVLGSDPQPPLVAYTEGHKIWWHFPGTLERQAKTVRRISWLLGDEVRYEVQGSRILTPEAAMAAAVDKLLGQFRRRYRKQPRSSPVFGGGGGIPDVVVAASDTKLRDSADLVCSGIDDVGTIEQAIARLRSDGGGWIHFLEGTYHIDRPILFGFTTATRHVKISGAGVDVTNFRIPNGTDAGIAVLWLHDATGGVNRYTMSDFSIDGNKANGADANALVHVEIASENHVYAENLRIHSGAGNGWDYARSAGAGWHHNVIVEGCGGHGMVGSGSHIKSFGCLYRNNGGVGYTEAFGSTHSLVACEVTGNGGDGLDCSGLGGVGELNLSLCLISGNGGHGIDWLAALAGTDKVVVVGNRILNNTGQSVICRPGSVVASNIIAGNGTDQPTVDSGGNVIGGVETPPIIPQTVNFSWPGDAAVTSGTFKWVAPKAGRFISGRLVCGESPVGLDLIVDVNSNGSTIYTTQTNRPRVVDADADGVGDLQTPDVTTFVAGDYVTVDIDQIGSTTPGADLTVILEIAYTEYA